MEPWIWTALTIAILGMVFVAFEIGRRVGTQQEAERTTERIEADRLHRRNRLRDRGRTTDRRPEHDGQASRVRPIRVTNERVVPGDQRQPRL